ncbi:MAG TPA: phage protein Gp27 family protein [Candidatus Binataceae bacterium]|nr:phage protein Gp27 family protein [Candidatus Binataceae bacterium]
MGDARKPEVVDTQQALPVRVTKEGKSYRDPSRNKLAQLPEELRAEVDRRLADSGNSCRAVSEWLEDEHATRIGPSSLQYRKKRLDLELLGVKYATSEARAIVEATGGDNEEINRALTTLVQTKLYDMLIQMNTVIEAFDRAGKANSRSAKVMKTRHRHQQKTGAAHQGEPSEGDLSPRRPHSAAVSALSALVRNTAMIGRHVMDTDKWDLDRQIKVAQLVKIADQKVTKIASEAGLSPEVEKTIRDALMEIKV